MLFWIFFSGFISSVKTIYDTAHVTFIWNLVSLKNEMLRNFLLSIFRDVLCGKLACVWPHKNTYQSDVQSTVYSYTQGHVCLSITTGSSVKSNGRDYAYVADGTVCGAQMVTKCSFILSCVKLCNSICYMMTITSILSIFPPSAITYFPYDIKKIIKLSLNYPITLFN